MAPPCNTAKHAAVNVQKFACDVPMWPRMLGVFSRASLHGAGLDPLTHANWHYTADFSLACSPVRVRILSTTLARL